MRPRALVAWMLLVTALAGCMAADGEPSAETRTVTSAGTAGAAEPAVHPFVGGLTSPWGVLPLRNGSALIGERDTGAIKLATDGHVSVVRTLADVRPAGEGGLLGLASTPDERTVLAYFTAAADNRIVSMTWDGKALGEPSVIFSGIPNGGRHNGGRMVVGPDGLLYVGTGETGDTDLSQDKGALGGKILRLTTAGKPAPGNPFGTAVYSYGHRNVEGLAFDGAGRLWASEFGDQSWDELNLIVAGGDYGWPTVEGSSTDPAFVNPKLVWNTSDASPSGLAYWKGELWMAALRGQQLWEIPLDGETASTPVGHFRGTYGRLRSVVATADAQTLLLSTSNTDGRGRPKAGDDRILQLSR